MTSTNDKPKQPEYSVQLSPSNDSEEKSVKSIGEDENVYAGDWAREMFEHQTNEQKPDIWLGYHDSAHRREVCIPYNSQFRHSTIFGGTGAGKTTLINNKLIQHAYAGHGFCFVDPKGEDTEDLLQKIPDERLDDIIWIDPARHNEGRIVGINFLDVTHNDDEIEYEAEVSNVVDDVVAILKGNDGWYARMNRVSRNLIRGMIYANKDLPKDEKYTLKHLHELLLDRQALIEFLAQVKDDDLRRFTNEISEMDAEELEPAAGRLQKWVENKITKEIIAHKESTVDIKEAVESGKIIIVRLKNVSEDAKQIITTAMTRRLWSAIQAREKLNDGEYDPYFLFIDELHQVATEDSILDTMLAIAREYKLSINLATQFPSQLPPELRDAIYGQCENLLAMRVMLPKDAGTVSQRFSKLSPEDFTNFGTYKIWTQLMIDGETKDPFVTETFPPYPPVRSVTETEDVISKSLQKYGAERKQTQESGATRNYEPTIEDDIPTADDLDNETVISCVAAIQFREHGNLDTPVPVNDCKELLRHYVDDETHTEVLSHRMEMMNFDSVAVNRESGEMVISLTQTGKKELFNDSGSASQAGKDTHRLHLLPKAIQALTEVGYLAHPVVQTGGTELPDGEANLPVTPDIKENAGFTAHERQQKQYRETLRDIHPRLPEISDGKHIHIEAETNPSSKGVRSLTNLVKAVDKEKYCMYVVKDGTSDTGRIEGHADKLIRVLEDPALVTDIDDEGRKYYYRDDYLKVTSENQEMGVLAPSETGVTKWRETIDGNGVELVDTENECVIMEFDTKEALTRVSKRDVPAYYTYDQSAKKYRVYEPRSDGGTDEITYDDKEVFQSNWEKVTGPFIPENEFSRMPTKEDWGVLIIPDDDNVDIDSVVEYRVNNIEDGVVSGELIEFATGDVVCVNDESGSTRDSNDEGEDEDEQQDLSGFFR